MFSQIRLLRASLRADFFRIVDDLLQNDMVRALDECPQHFKFTRLRHSLDVAYFSYVLARFFGLDFVSVARAGLLHDLFFHEEGQGMHSLLFSHPRIALENARRICALSELEEDIILRHMWLLTLRPPKYREGFLVSFMDKYCAAREFAVSLFLRGEATGLDALTGSLSAAPVARETA